jgi:hypothetical protein
MIDSLEHMENRSKTIKEKEDVQNGLALLHHFKAETLKTMKKFTAEQFTSEKCLMKCSKLEKKFSSKVEKLRKEEMKQKEKP